MINLELFQEYYGIEEEMPPEMVSNDDFRFIFQIIQLSDSPPLNLDSFYKNFPMELNKRDLL